LIIVLSSLSVAIIEKSRGCNLPHSQFWKAAVSSSSLFKGITLQQVELG